MDGDRKGFFTIATSVKDFSIPQGNFSRQDHWAIAFLLHIAPLPFGFYLSRAYKASQELG